MTLDDLKQLLANRLVFLDQQRVLAVDIGDVARVDALDAEKTETEFTVSQLDTL